MEMSDKSNDYSQVIENDRNHVWHHLTQHKKYESGDPMMIIEGKGMRVWDATGKQYLDATSGGVWTVNVGYGRTEIADAIRDQLVKLNFFVNTMGSIPGANFASALIEKMPGMSRVFLSSSGSEANEKAYKMIRQIAHAKYGGKKHKILFRDRDYHGTTITALSSTGQEQRKAQFGPFTPGFVQVPHCLEYRSQWGQCEDYGLRAAQAIEEIILAEGPDTVGGLVLEPVTAGGGVITPPKGYWAEVQAICKRHDILLHIDEVVCGLGRTGKWFGYQHYDIKPDIVTMAKGVASGYAAISCTVTTEEVFEHFKQTPDDNMSLFRDISTFGGCNAGPAAALENLRIIERDGLLANATVMGKYLMKKLIKLQEKHSIIGDVRGLGLFCGLELVMDRDTKDPASESFTQAIVADCMAQGVLIGATSRSFDKFNNTLCLAPALICTKEDLDEIVAAIDTALGRAS